MAHRKAKALKTRTSLMTLHTVKATDGETISTGTQADDGPEFTTAKMTMNRGIQVPLLEESVPVKFTHNQHLDPVQMMVIPMRHATMNGTGKYLIPALKATRLPLMLTESGTLSQGEAQVIVDRKAQRSSSMPPPLPLGTLGIQPTNQMVMTTVMIKQADHQSWYDFQLSVTNKFIHERNIDSSMQKPTLGRVSHLRGRCSRIPLYQAIVDSHLTLVTTEEYKQMFPKCKNMPVTTVVAMNKRVTTKLHHRLSKCFCWYTNTHTQIVCCRQQGKPHPQLLTQTMDALIDLYFDDVLQNGSQALPDRVDDMDEEFYAYVVSRTPNPAGGQHQ